MLHIVVVILFLVLTPSGAVAIEPPAEATDADASATEEAATPSPDGAETINWEDLLPEDEWEELQEQMLQLDISPFKKRNSQVY